MTIRTALTAACLLPLLAACGEDMDAETPPQEGEFGVGEEEDVNDRASTEASGIEQVDAAPGDGPPGGEASFEAPDAPSAFNEELLPFTARGNEPGWLLEITDSTLSLEYDYGQQTLSADAYERSELEDGARFAVPDEDLRVMVRDARCTAASGMPHPFTVEVRLGERSFQGCGGETRDLLVGEAYTVTALNGEPVVQSETPPSLRFTEADIGGSTGCNTYRAAYTLTGETIDISAGESTQMACAEDLMAQEEAFLAALEAVSRLRIEGEGSLRLEGETAMIEAARGG
ncbi:MAG: META domain-containing protein [Oceanicaulis sp.]